jgi:protein-S-isoprenylcysteine O-methyltransferase Ste14
MHTATASSGHRPSVVASVLQATANLLVLALFALLAVASYRQFLADGSFKSFGVLTANAMFAGLFLLRREAKSEETALSIWILSLAGTTFPLLMRPIASSPWQDAGHALQFVGIVLVIVALLSLRRSFAVVPANRGIRVDGMYRYVRHPLYAAELLLLLGVVVANPSTLNILIWCAECVLQYARARVEESFLAADPDYHAYLGRVRHRLVPGIV